MQATFTDLTRILGSRRFWTAMIRLSVLAAIGLAILALVFTTFLIVLPLALLGGLALHLYLRRRIRRAATRFSGNVIEGEYRVIGRP